MLNKCAKFGMECEGRKFAECQFYKLLMKEKRELERIELHKSWTETEKEEAQKEYMLKWRIERAKEANQIEVSEHA